MSRRIAEKKTTGHPAQEGSKTMQFILRRFGYLLSLTLLISSTCLKAQSVAVSPGYIDIAAGANVQYTAAVSGLTNKAVTWSLRGSNSSQPGTITSSGLYSAPPTVPSGTVTITALASDRKTSATVYVNVAAAGPTITAVSPNPVFTGNYTITLTGNGFVSGSRIVTGGVSLLTTYVNAHTLTARGYQASGGPVAFQAGSPGSLLGPIFTVNFQGKASQSISPSTVSLKYGASVQFSAPGATSWSASVGSISPNGFYTAPAASSGTTATVNATGPNGTASAVIQLTASAPTPVTTPIITSVGNSQLLLGICGTTIRGTGFTSQSVAQLSGIPFASSLSNGALTVVGHCGQAGPAHFTVSNVTVASAPFPVTVGVTNALATPAAARRLLEQGAFGPTPTDAAHVQAIGLQAWVNEQIALPQISTYSNITTSQNGMSPHFLTNAVSNKDQLRQRVGFALSQIFVTSADKLIWNFNMVPYQDMLLADSFSNFRRIMSDVTLSPAMGEYLDAANNAKANPSIGSLANENYAREVMQLFTIGTDMLNQDGSLQIDSHGLPIPTYSQSTIAELARVFTGWTYAPAPGHQLVWGNGTYDTYTGPLVPFTAEHDFGSKQLLNGYVSPAGSTPQQDIDNALDNIFNHPNVGPFIGKQLIQHLVKSNPSPAYIARVAAAFNNNGKNVRGDMQATIVAVLLDPEARANDQGGKDQITDGHLQEPALFIAGMVRAFGGQMTDQNYYPQQMALVGQDLFDSPSVFNYYSPGYSLPGTSLTAGEFEIYTPNTAIIRANLVSTLFGQYTNPVQSYGPGTSVDLTPFVPLASTPSTLVDALDLTLTHGAMPSAMKSTLVNAVTADTGSSLHHVQMACYLILTSSYYNVWH